MATGGAGGEPLGPCETAIVENCGDEYAVCGGVCQSELLNAQDCLIDVINTTGSVTTDDQWVCGESAGADGPVITTEFSDLYVCMMCSEQAADMCLGGFTDPTDCGG
jgi:hypothetical protein